MAHRIGVLLSGNGVYDGSEIHESVFTLLAIDENRGEAVCMAPNIDQHHVVNHISGDEMPEKRNVLIEAARIARGAISDLAEISVENLDALVIPGGFGAAKNLTKWAFNGPDGEIEPDVKRIISEMVKAGKPIVGICMGPTVIAKALEGAGLKEHLSVGTTEEASPYEIDDISKGLEKAGAVAEMKSINEISIDETNKIICAPSYMMEGSITDVRNNIKQGIDELFEMLES
ncbi:MAG TPA: isoprenoid biosynthesis protein ElbB [Flavobacteriales bacterium]|nr:isoprenoid biosynthesis glyoxalase ElbB [Flavobacteriales bacterium]MDB4678332.1 isoprenoid biosynthesis glyoxalase ElbB [bacterium]HAP70288.1 isoprenoid biosynthesis protein ElbB [Flavobacteriales bacterium]